VKDEASHLFVFGVDEFWPMWRDPSIKITTIKKGFAMHNE
jgi:hypothetical protein